MVEVKIGVTCIQTKGCQGLLKILPLNIPSPEKLMPVLCGEGVWKQNLKAEKISVMLGTQTFCSGAQATKGKDREDGESAWQMRPPPGVSEQ